MRVLAAYYFLKSQLSHAIIYDYRSRKYFIADILGVSERTVRTYMHLWSRWGLTHGHKTNLVLTATQKVKKALRERRRYRISIAEGETIETIENRLYGKLLEQHAERITWYKRQHRFLSKNKKRAQSSDAKITDRGERLQAPPVSLSLRNIAKVLNVSRFKANEIIQKLNSLRVILTTKSQPRRVCKAPAKSVSATDGLPGYFFSAGGTTYQVFGNLHTFLEYPPNNDDLTYRQFMTLYRNSKHTTKKVIHDIYTAKSPQLLNFQ